MGYEATMPGQPWQGYVPQDYPSQGYPAQPGAAVGTGQYYPPGQPPYGGARGAGVGQYPAVPGADPRLQRVPLPAGQPLPAITAAPAVSPLAAAAAASEGGQPGLRSQPSRLRMPLSGGSFRSPPKITGRDPRAYYDRVPMRVSENVDIFKNGDAGWLALAASAFYNPLQASTGAQSTGVCSSLAQPSRLPCAVSAVAHHPAPHLHSLVSLWPQPHPKRWAFDHSKGYRICLDGISGIELGFVPGGALDPRNTPPEVSEGRLPCIVYTQPWLPWFYMATVGVLEVDVTSWFQSCYHRRALRWSLHRRVDPPPPAVAEAVLDASGDPAMPRGAAFPGRPDRGLLRQRLRH